MSYKPLGDKIVRDWISILGTNPIFNGLSQNQQTLYIDNGQQECAILSKSNNLEFYKADSSLIYNIFAVGGSSDVYKSTEKGSSWSSVGTRPCGTPDSVVNTPIITVGNMLFCVTYGNGVYRSIDYGVTWVQVNTGLLNLFTWCLAYSNSFLYVGTENNIYISSDNGANWTAISSWIYPQNICHSLFVDGNNLYVGTDAGIYVTSNNGASWTTINTGLAPTDIRSIVKCNDILFCVDFANGIYKFDGASWTSCNTGLLDLRMTFLYSHDNQLFSGGKGRALYNSIDNGASWTPIIYYTATSQCILGMMIVNNYLFVADAYGIFRFINSNLGWQYVDQVLDIDIRSFTLISS
jgi:photosystem II stability/assembly factor-like uncharacterized protein